MVGVPPGVAELEGHDRHQRRHRRSAEQASIAPAFVERAHGKSAKDRCRRREMRRVTGEVDRGGQKADGDHHVRNGEEARGRWYGAPLDDDQRDREGGKRRHHQDVRRPKEGIADSLRRPVQLKEQHLLEHRAWIHDHEWRERDRQANPDSQRERHETAQALRRRQYNQGGRDPDASPELDRHGDAAGDARHAGISEGPVARRCPEPEPRERKAGEIEHGFEHWPALLAHRFRMCGIQQRGGHAGQRSEVLDAQPAGEHDVGGADERCEHPRQAENEGGIERLGESRDRRQQQRECRRMNENKISVRDDAAREQRCRREVHALVVVDLVRVEAVGQEQRRQTDEQSGAGDDPDETAGEIPSGGARQVRTGHPVRVGEPRESITRSPIALASSAGPRRVGLTPPAVLRSAFSPPPLPRPQGGERARSRSEPRATPRTPA